VAPSTFLVLSLWSSLFPVPMAGAGRGHRLGRDCKADASSKNVAERARGFSIREITVSQSFTFIDAGGNQAQYTVYEADWHGQFPWSTDHGDRGSGVSYTQAQSQARVALKASMAERRKLAQRY
jgi:hypothetical protein